MSNLNLGDLVNSLSELSTEKTENDAEKNKSTIELNIAEIKVLEQHRKNFNEDDLKKLMSSIKEIGVIQPILVRPDKDKYILIAGERRLRACKELEIEVIPARIIDVDDFNHNIAQLAENTARKDLNNYEILDAFLKLKSLDPKISNVKVANFIGKSRRFVGEIARISENPNAIKFLAENQDHSIRLLSDFLKNYGDTLSLSSITYEAFFEHFDKINNSSSLEEKEPDKIEPFIDNTDDMTSEELDAIIDGNDNEEIDAGATFTTDNSKPKIEFDITPMMKKFERWKEENPTLFYERLEEFKKFLNEMEM